MNTRHIITVVALVTAIPLAAAAAVTEQWRVAASGTVYQVFADGKGGCAFVERTSGPTGTVVWVDKKGAVVYRSRNVVLSVPIIMISDCNKKQLLYTAAFGFLPYPAMVQVDAKGNEDPVAIVGGIVLGQPFLLPLSFSRLADKKGFFIVNADTNSGAQAVVRYSFK